MRALQYQRHTQPQRYTSRTFSTTPRRLAEEVPDEFINAIRHTALFQKLADKPGALKALSDLYALTKEMGVLLLLSLFYARGGQGSIDTFSSLPSSLPSFARFDRSRHQLHDEPTFPVSDVQTRDKSEICEGCQARDGRAQCGRFQDEF